MDGLTSRPPREVDENEFIELQQTLPLFSKRPEYELRALNPARDSSEAQGEARLWQARAAIREAFYRALAAQQRAATLRSGLAHAHAPLSGPHLVVPEPEVHVERLPASAAMLRVGAPIRNV